MRTILPGLHQSGRNSGVIHAGIYYTPGTLKAKLCLEGSKLAYDYCRESGIPFRRVGKLIVAVEDKEVMQLENLYQRGQQNGISDLLILDQIEVQKIEPLVNCMKAIWSPSTGIVDWGQVTKKFEADFKSRRGKTITNFKVSSIKYKSNEKILEINDLNGEKVKAKFLVTAAGLYSDVLAKMTGCGRSPVIIPFRGEYLLLKNKTVKTNIYPVPDPRFPFLGAHFTPRMDGSVWIGPNALLSFRREGYQLTDFDLKELSEYSSFPGFRKLITKHMMAGLKEFRNSLIPSAQVQQLKKMIPSLELGDVIPGSAGVRAQAVDNEGNLVEDFVFDSGVGEMSERVLHVRNAPSPAATSSLAIAKVVCDMIQKRLLSLL